MKHLTLISLIILTLASGCQKSLTQGEVERNILTAISQGQPAEVIERIILQSENPSQTANYGIREVTNLSHLPQNIEKYWQFYQPKPIRETPTIEIFGILNRYKISVLKVLVLHGGNLNQKQDNGEPYIRFSSNTLITPELLAWLLDHGYDANLTYETNSNDSAIGYCAQPGQSMLRYDQKYEMIKMLLEHGANPNVTSLGEPIMHTLAIYHKDNPYALKIFGLLLEAGCSPDDTVLISALGARRDEMALLLLEHTETIDATSQFSSRLMSLAAAYGNQKCVEMLISRGIDVNTADASGYTPLHAATADRNEVIIAMLLEAGAILNPVNNKGQTPLDIATTKNQCQQDESINNKIIDQLRKYGCKYANEL